MRDQTYLLQNSLLDLLTIRAVWLLSKSLANNPDEIVNGIPIIKNSAYRFICESDYEHAKNLRDYARRMLRWKLDDTEVALLSASLLVCPGRLQAINH